MPIDLSNLSTLQKLLSTLTWKKILQLAVFLFILAVALITYETRESIYNFVNQSRIATGTPPVQTLSKKGAAAVDDLVTKTELISGIQITTVDFQRNTRLVIHTSIQNTDLKIMYALFQQRTFNELPIFNDDVINNKRMVGLINGEFVCSPYSETFYYKAMPDGAKYIHTVCSNSIPPFYGKFSGIVTIFIKRQPLPEEIDQIRAVSKSLSAAIYITDFK